MPKQRKSTLRARSLKTRLPDPPREKIRPGWDTAEPPTHPPAPRRLLSVMSSDQRKTFPITKGFLDYFPDACAAVAEISYYGNEKHNPGQPLHWARGKSMDHADCCARHLVERGGFDVVMIDGVAHRMRHTACLAWRSMALLQEELEAEMNLAAPRGAGVPNQT